MVGLTSPDAGFYEEPLSRSIKLYPHFFPLEMQFDGNAAGKADHELAGSPTSVAPAHRAVRNTIHQERAHGDEELRHFERCQPTTLVDVIRHLDKHSASVEERLVGFIHRDRSTVRSAHIRSVSYYCCYQGSTRHPMPRVSIIMATYNRSDLLRCAIATVQFQTFHDWEVIIVGDACTDETADVVSAIQDPRIRSRKSRDEFRRAIGAS